MNGFLDNDDLQIIQQNYGDKMCMLCVNSFTRILSYKPGILPDVLLKHFKPSLTLYDDLVHNNQINEFTSKIWKESMAMMSINEQIAMNQIDETVCQANLIGDDPFGDFVK